MRARTVVDLRTWPVRGAATWAWKAWVLPTNEDVIVVIFPGQATGSVVVETALCQIAMFHYQRAGSGLSQ